MVKIKAIIFDWGDTIMRDFPSNKDAMFTWKEVFWIPGAKEVLEYVNIIRIPCCIATNAGISDTQAMIKALERIDAKKYFHNFFSSKELGVEKPDVAFFEKICLSINCLPNECLMIGNSYEKDIIGAKKAGLKTIWFNEKNEIGHFSHSDYIVFQMYDCIKIINEISQK